MTGLKDAVVKQQKEELEKHNFSSEVSRYQNISSDKNKNISISLSPPLKQSKNFISATEPTSNDIPLSKHAAK
jgi:hypothetical protein